MVLADRAAADSEGASTMRLRPHPVVYLRAVVWAAIAAALFAMTWIVGGLLWSVAAALFLAGALVAAVEAAVQRATTELRIGERRLVLREGVLRTRLSEIFVAGLAGLEMRRTPLGRFLGYGWLRIPGLGEGSKWLPIEAPDEVRARIEEVALAFGSAEPRRRRRDRAGRLSVIEGAAGKAQSDRRATFRDGLAPPIRPQAELDRIV